MIILVGEGSVRFRIVAGALQDYDCRVSGAANFEGVSPNNARLHTIHS
jgi:hypothetical protein